MSRGPPKSRVTRVFAGGQGAELPRCDDARHPDGPRQADGAPQPHPGHHAAVQARHKLQLDISIEFYSYNANG